MSTATKLREEIDNEIVSRPELLEACGKPPGT